MYRLTNPAPSGMGCAGASGCGCGGKCPGIGQASISNVGTDFTALLSDVFMNSDGSVNLTAVGFAAVAVFLIAKNWGNTTRRGRR